ncbi:hypothetical protein AC231_04605 [Clostridium pasteurianum]|nr:hypothetical protein AQ983_11670 [Clostridium pasteurianum DSM 525 = ATCC 6013]AOZ79508.1 hypothetical protein AQ984_11665 [Clostridium pasteurianum]ELP60382.1 hypothetical protein F502_02817 [Clostridium pasteurianum DSM 525 = ATCC 6013]OMH20073.1 hypothetical protein AC231_04605 [Clostridium pasteurianum]
MRISNLVNDKDILLRWNSFCRKTIKFHLDFKVVILEILKFIEIPFKAILEEDETFYIWYHEQKTICKN